MARTADRTLTLVLDPGDDVDTLARLRRLHARPLGQIVCEPAPGDGTSGLARSLLAALGKTVDLDGHCEPLWRLVGLHLHAERVHDVIVVRAHTLTYPALRRLADDADEADAQLWLVVHQERPPAPVAQLLEALPHQAASLQELLEHTPQLAELDADADLPPGAGVEFPYLSAIHDLFNPVPRRRVHATLTRDLPAPSAPPSTTPGINPTTGSPAGWATVPSGRTSRPPTPSWRSRAPPTPPWRSTCVSARRSTPSIAQASTPTSAPSTASLSTATARSVPASSTPASPGPPRSPTKRPTRSSPR